MNQYLPILITTWWWTAHESCWWVSSPQLQVDIAPTYPIYNQGCNPLTKWDEPPSMNHH